VLSDGSTVTEGSVVSGWSPDALALDASELLSDGSVEAVGTAEFSLTSSPGVHAATASTPATRRRRPFLRCIGAL